MVVLLLRASESSCTDVVMATERAPIYARFASTAQSPLTNLASDERSASSQDSAASSSSASTTVHEPRPLASNSSAASSSSSIDPMARYEWPPSSSSSSSSNITLTSSPRGAFSSLRLVEASSSSSLSSRNGNGRRPSTAESNYSQASSSTSSSTSRTKQRTRTRSSPKPQTPLIDDHGYVDFGTSSPADSSSSSMYLKNSNRPAIVHDRSTLVNTSPTRLKASTSYSYFPAHIEEATPHQMNGHAEWAASRPPLPPKNGSRYRAVSSPHRSSSSISSIEPEVLASIVSPDKSTEYSRFRGQDDSFAYRSETKNAPIAEEAHSIKNDRFDAVDMDRTPSLTQSDWSGSQARSTSTTNSSSFVSPASSNQSCETTRTSILTIDSVKSSKNDSVCGLGIEQVPTSTAASSPSSHDRVAHVNKLRLAHSSTSPIKASARSHDPSTSPSNFGEGDIEASLAELRRFAQSLPSPTVSTHHSSPSLEVSPATVASNWPPPSPGIYRTFTAGFVQLYPTRPALDTVDTTSSLSSPVHDSSFRSPVSATASAGESVSGWSKSPTRMLHGRTSEKGSGSEIIVHRFGNANGEDSIRSTLNSEVDWKHGHGTDNTTDLGKEKKRCLVVDWSRRTVDMTGVLPMETTHLLLGHSTPSTSIPSLLRKVLPSLNPGLVVLDLSYNELSTLPTVVASCSRTLEELSISGNPLKELPDWILNFYRLRVLLADDCDLLAVPEVVQEWKKLEILSLKDNKLDRLPAWLCRCSNLKRFELDGNEWEGDWKDVVAPLLKPARSRHDTPSLSISAKTSEAPRKMSIPLDSGKLEPRDGLMLPRSISASALVVPASPSASSSRGRTPSPSPSTVPSPTSGSISPGSDFAPSSVATNSGAGSFSKMINRIRSRSISGKKPPVLDRSHSEPLPVPPPPITVESGLRRERKAKRASFLLSPRGNYGSIPTELASTHDDRTEDLLEEEEEDDVEDDERAGEIQHRDGLKSVMAYLKDLDDLTEPSKRSSLAFAAAAITSNSSTAQLKTSPSLGSIRFAGDSGNASMRRAQSSRRLPSGLSKSISTDEFDALRMSLPGGEGGPLKIRDDPVKREAVVKEILESEKTYLKGLEELVAIYIIPSATTQDGKEILPLAERKAVFANVQGIRDFHADVLLPDLSAAVASSTSAASYHLVDPSQQWLLAAIEVARVFARHAAFFKIYSTFVNSFDAALARIQSWSIDTAPSRPGTANAATGTASRPSSSRPSTAQGIPAALARPLTDMNLPGLAGSSKSESNSLNGHLTPNQKKRIRLFLKRCKLHPQHSQISLESYLLLPVQRVPRYRMLLESLMACTPYIIPLGDPNVSPRDSSLPLVPHPVLHEAVKLISEVAVSMNERKRETEGRAELLHWQGRIGQKFRSPLVQPHRSLVKSGTITLVRLVKKAASSARVNVGESTTATTLITDRVRMPLTALLCTDLLVFVKGASTPADSQTQVELYTVVRLSSHSIDRSIRQGPATAFGADQTMLRMVCDTRAVLYFQCGSKSEAQTWARSINLQWEFNT